MPQRFLRPGLTNSDRWNAVSFGAQSLFVRILTLVDDFGRYDGRLPILHGQCFALRNDVKPQHTAGFRSELHAAGLILVYEVDGKEFLQVTKWQERARGDRSKYPNPQPPQDSAADRSGPLAKDASLATTSSPLHPRSSPAVEPPTADAEASPGKPVKPTAPSDADWMESLISDPAYAGIDVKAERAKMVRWCEVNNKKASRKRLINWLNRVERPMAAGGGPVRANYDSDQF
jgi:hypothetical protein